MRQRRCPIPEPRPTKAMIRQSRLQSQFQPLRLVLLLLRSASWVLALRYARSPAAVVKASLSRKMVPVLWDTGGDLPRKPPYGASAALSGALDQR